MDTHANPVKRSRIVAEDVDAVIEQWHLALGELVKGNPAPLQAIFSHREDVSLANPFGPAVRGWKLVSETMARAASLYRGGEATGFENVSKLVTPELAYVVEIERFRAKFVGSEDAGCVVLRVTTVLRPEDGAWKIVHRHADPITTARPIESVMQQG
ncbi:MAG: YybH family protein [Panacagrimonas sp.]